MKTSEFVGILPGLEGSLIEEILVAMSTKINTDFMSEFSPFDEETDLVMEGSKLNEFETACIYLGHKCGPLEKELVAKLHGLNGADDSNFSEVENKLAVCRSKFKLVDKLIWDNIRRRLGNPEHGLGIRKDSQIVSLKGNSCDGCNGCDDEHGIGVRVIHLGGNGDLFDGIFKEMHER